jgi:hypothetical protein
MVWLESKALPKAEAATRALQAARQRGDRAAALALLTPEASFSGGGHTQSCEEYANSHLGEDIAFLERAMIGPISLGSMPMDDTAMVGSESNIKVVNKSKPVTLRNRDMLTLKRVGGAWRMIAIQWQSPPHTGKTPWIKVVAASGWFAARPSGTEAIYKIVGESFTSAKDLPGILAGVQQIVDAAIAGD